MRQVPEYSEFKNEAIREIFSDKYEALLSYAQSITLNSALVEDCIQDLFLKFCENQDLILNSNNKEAYLKTSLKRQILQKLKQNQSQNQFNSKLLEFSVPSYEELLINKQSSLSESLQIKKCLNQLSPSQKTILTLRFYKSLSYEEIAHKLDISKRTVYNQVHDAMKKLRKSYK